MSHVVQVVHADALTCTPEYLAQFHVQISDLPYSQHVHESAVSCGPRGATSRDFGFGHLSTPLLEKAAEAAANVKRWTLLYSDVESSHVMRAAAASAGAAYIRTIPWVRWSMPQLSGDRPAQGFEHLVIFHGTNKGAKHWNGPGNLTDLAHDAAELEAPPLGHLCLRGNGKHKTEKPLDQMLDLVSWFTDPGEIVLDLTSGSGTTAAACELLGRNCMALELDEAWAKAGAARINDLHNSSPSARDLERIRRWLTETRYEPTAQGDGPTKERAEKRARDKALLATFR